MALGSGSGAALGGAYGEIVLRTDKSERNVKQLQGTISQFGQTAGSSLDRVATGLGLLGAARGLGNIFAGAIGGAATFEQRMSAVGAVAAATSEQLAALRDEAIRIGRDTAYSASQGAEALEELAKAGVSVEDILAGASRGAVALGAAAGIGIPQSATIIANALNQYGLAGDQAVRVADLIAAASSTSSAGAQDIGEALAYVGTSAAALNIPIEDTIAGIAALADVGIVGSRAGTSLAAALNAVVAPTAKASGQMAALGIAATDLNGNFVGLDSLLEQVATATASMGDAQRQAALDAIFGVEGGRAINALLATQSAEAAKAGKSWEDYQQNVGQAGAAADQAAKRQDNFAGSVEQLRGSIETAAIVVGSIFLPALRDVVDVATTAVNAFTSLPTPLLAIAGASLGAGAGLLGVAGALTLAGPRLGEFRANLIGTRTAMLGLAKGHPILLGIAGAAALAGVAYKTNFLGFRTITDGVVDSLAEFGDAFQDTYAAIQRFGTFGNVGAGFSALGQAIDDAFGTDVTKLFNKAGRSADNLGEGVGRIARQFSRLGKIIRRDGLAEGIDRLFGDIGKKMLSGVGDAASALPRAIGTLLGGITTGIGPLDSALSNTGRGLELFGKALEAVFDGDLGRAADLTRAAVARIATAAGTLGGSLLDAVGAAFDAIPWGALWETAKAGLVAAAGGLLELGSLALDAALDFAGDLAALAADAAGWVAGKIPALVDATLPLGSAAVSAVVSLAGDLLALGEGGVGWVRDKLPSLGKLALTTGGVTVSALVELAGTILDLATRGIGWVSSQIPYLGALALTAAASTVSGLVTLAGVIGDVAGRGVGWVADQIPAIGGLVLTAAASTVSAAVGLAGELLALSTRGAGFVREKVGALAAVAFPKIAATLDATIGLAGDLLDAAADLGGWVWSRFFATSNFLLPVAAFRLSATIGLTPSDLADAGRAVVDGVVGAVEGITDLGGRVGGAVVAKIRSIDWVGLVTADSFNLGQAFGTGLRGAIAGAADVVTGIARGIGAAIQKIDLSDVDWGGVAGKIATGLGTLLLTGPAVATGLGVAIASFIGGAITGLVFGEGDADWGKVAGQIGDGLVAGLKGLTTFGAEILLAIAELIAPGSADFLVEGAEIAKQIGSALVTGIGTLATFGVDALQGLADALTNAEFDFTNMAATVGQKMVDAVGNFVKDNWNPLDWFSMPGGGEDDTGGAETLSNRPGMPNVRAGSTTREQLNTYQPAAAPVAPPPVVFPAPNLTAYVAGLATAVQALQTTVGVIGAVAQGVIGPLGAAAAAAIGAFNANLALGWITAVQITIGGIGAIKGVAAGGSLFGEGSGLGASFGQGVVSGIAGYVSLVYAAGAAIGQAAINGAKSTIRPGSPSRAAIELFTTVPQGAVKAMADGLAAVRAAGERLAGAALIPPMTPTLDLGRIMGQQQTTTAQMLGSQPTGRAGIGSGGSTTVHVYALKSDEWVEMVRKNERGGRAADYVDDLYPMFARMLG